MAWQQSKAALQITAIGGLRVLKNPSRYSSVYLHVSSGDFFALPFPLVLDQLLHVSCTPLALIDFFCLVSLWEINF